MVTNPGGRSSFDWSRIEKPSNNKDFEDMCLDLFGEEYGDVSFVPGPRRTGKDGGVDGVYDGPIGRISGRWKIACAIRKDLPSLNRKIDDERNQAVGGGYTGLVMMTSLDLKAPDVELLKKRGRQSTAANRDVAKKLKHVVVWGRSSIERMLAKHPWVAAKYFGHQSIHGFVPLFGDDTRDIAEQRDLALVGREAELEVVRSFLGGQNAVLILVATGGAGKSRFLRELPALARSCPIRWSSWARRPGIGTIEDGLKSVLPKTRPLLIGLDDAGRAVDEVRQLAFWAADNCGARKVVLAVRPADLELVESILMGVPRASRQNLKLSPLKADRVVDIATLEHPGLPGATAKKLAQYFGENLFLLRAAASMVRDGKSLRELLAQSQLRDLIAERFLGEAARYLANVEAVASVHQRLLRLALDVPVPAEPSTVESRTLLQSGLLRQVGSTLRFRADVEGDLLLGYFLARPWARAVLDGALASQPRELRSRIRNLASAWGGNADEVLDGVCQRWLDEASSQDAAGCREVLRMLPWCVRAAPERVGEICEAYARVQEGLASDDFGPVVVSLARSDQHLKALRLLRSLSELGVPNGTFSNYQLQGAAREIASFHHLGRAEANGLLGELESWVQGTLSSPVCAIIQSVVAKLLSPVVSWDSSDRETITMHEQALPASPDVLALRQRAIDLVGMMLLHDSTTVRVAAVGILGSHLQTGGGRIAAVDELRDAQLGEFQRLLPSIQQCLAVERDVSVLDGVEDVLIKRWAGQLPGAADAGVVLRTHQWSYLFRAFQLASKGWDFHLDIALAMVDAPDEDRWGWWVHRKVEGVPAADIASLVSSLALQYSDVPGLASVLDVLKDTQNPGIVLDPWCRRDPDLFRQAIEVGGAGIPVTLLMRTLRRHDFATSALDALAETQRLLRQGSGRVEVAQLLEDASLLERTTRIAVARELVGVDDLAMRELGLRLVRVDDSQIQSERYCILEVALRDGCWFDGWDMIYSFLHDAPGRKELASRPKLRAMLEERLAETLAMHHSRGNANDVWYFKEIIGALCGNDVEHRVALFAQVASSDACYDEVVAELLGVVVSTGKGLRALARTMVELVESGRVGEDACAQLVGAAVDARNWSSEALIVARECLANDQLTMRKIGVVLLSEMRDSAEACADLARLACGDGQLAKFAHQGLHKFTIPRGGWTGGLGKPAPAFVRIQEVLSQASGLAETSEVRKRIAELQDGVKRWIQSDLRRDEEQLDPR